jgi:uncharacterized protein YbjT (DUF2867 family)
MIVITTPTGAIGRQLLEKLLDTKEELRLIVRDASKLPVKMREGVEVIEGSHGDPEVVDKAFLGAGSVFWLVPPNFQAVSLEQAYVGFTRPAAEAIRKHAVERVVVVSALGRGWPRHTGYVSASIAMDDLIESTGVSCRVLTMPGFMDNTLRQIQPIKNQGVFFGTHDPDLKLPYCSTGDIATVASKWLLDTSWTGQQDVPVLGPEDLSCNDMAQILSDVLGKPIRYQQIPFAALKTQLKERGASDAMAQGMIDMVVAKNEGLDRMVPRTPEGTTPTTFRQWCEQELKPALLS